ncbi:hypothetical protein PACTADRAFT_48149 [Pachysolen tannophilus NRRL Y-2460]|uniref:Uncharacterized protein n=1 Tax=Pachysolen tannophilus NRRL Y-2460 TaxID=669874 RepID=A0A1E4U304_PACTA|nr:hypothetical protein PACTADRAFT_48149 [Pachysolen tannophilus NRRL Y-2460]
MKGDEDLDRRANPPNWVQPKAPYNPYDITDVRPPGGYPSEFKAPGRESTFTEIPKDATEYSKLRHTMKNLQYTPRPPSELYPGKYKVLRRINPNARFNSGMKLASRVLIVGISIYGIMFYRWNDGFDNVFSECYRFQLRVKQYLTGNLTDQQIDDLVNPRSKPFFERKYSSVSDAPIDVENYESEYALQKPTAKQMMEAERIQAERELAALRQSEPVLVTADNFNYEEDKRKKWFGIF